MSEITEFIVAVSAIFTVVASILGILIKYISKKADQKNESQFNSIFKVLDNHGKILEGVKCEKAKHDIQANIRRIAQGSTHSAPDEIIKIYVNNLCEDIICFAEEVIPIDGSWIDNVYETAEVKLKIIFDEVTAEAVKNIGQNFTIAYKPLLMEAIAELKLGIQKLSDDKIVNMKHERIGRLMIVFADKCFIGAVQCYWVLRINNAKS